MSVALVNIIIDWLPSHQNHRHEQPIVAADKHINSIVVEHLWFVAIIVQYEQSAKY